MLARFGLGAVAAAVALAGPIAPAKAAFPEKDITFVIPFSTGGGFDTYVRLIAPFLEKHLPYAIALDIDSEHVSMRAKSLDWYRGKPGSFSAHDFTSSLKMKRPGVGKASHLPRPRSAGAGL